MPNRILLNIKIILRSDHSFYIILNSGLSRMNIKLYPAAGFKEPRTDFDPFIFPFAYCQKLPGFLYFHLKHNFLVAMETYLRHTSFHGN